MKTNPVVPACSFFLRIALSLSFLSAVADRFGFWGPYGQPHVAWGDFSHFVAYAAKLNSFMPVSTIPFLAWMATGAETILAIALLFGAFIDSLFHRHSPDPPSLCFAIAVTTQRQPPASPQDLARKSTS